MTIRPTSLQVVLPSSSLSAKKNAVNRHQNSRVAGPVQQTKTASHDLANFARVETGQHTHTTKTLKMMPQNERAIRTYQDNQSMIEDSDIQAIFSVDIKA